MLTLTLQNLYQTPNHEQSHNSTFKQALSQQPRPQLETYFGLQLISFERNSSYGIKPQLPPINWSSYGLDSRRRALHDITRFVAGVAPDSCTRRKFTSASSPFTLGLTGSSPRFCKYRAIKEIKPERVPIPNSDHATGIQMRQRMIRGYD